MVHKASNVFTSSPTLVIFFGNVLILMGVTWYLTMILISISLITKVVAHLFALLAICMSSLEECLNPLPVLDFSCLFCCRCRVVVTDLKQDIMV